METVNVFVSSTWVDMVAEREAIKEAAMRMQAVRFVGMEYFGARTGTTRQVSLDEVDRCQIYVGVLGYRWGSGITEAEYRRAVARGLPCLIYQKAGVPPGDAQPSEDAERHAAWLRELRAAHTVALFEEPAELAAQVVADLHNLVFQHRVVQGIGQLHTDYEARIQRFLAEYLGTPGAPVPFGGRDAELAELDRWLENPGGGPYAVVAGPAGRGKSALLAHWTRRVAVGTDLSLVYFPISIRFRTNLASVAFMSITARLAAVHGEPLLAGPETPTEVWREMMSAYLRRPPPEGRRLLVVLDGADESADWQLGPDIFSATPPDRLRVLVSARYLPGDVDARGWIERLAWNRPHLSYPLDLAPLTPHGLADVLHQTSVPLDALSQRADVVAELFRLSEGDPLLVNLYVSDLWARGEEVARLRPEDLQALQPGLEGYFRRWWGDQRALWGEQSPFLEPAINTVFNALACALGPLRTAELLELLPAAGQITVWALDDVMQGLKRLVVGDGSTQGYAFSHPRLAEYFYEQLTKAGAQREQEMRFVSWGRSCLEQLAAGRISAAAVPTYLLYFLRPHFDRAGCGVDDYVGIAGLGWVRAWDRLDKGSYSGFLADLRRVCDLAARDNDLRVGRGETLVHLAIEIRGALSTASIASQAADMSVALLGALLQHGIWSPAQAIAYATRIPDTRDRLHALLTMIAVTEEAHRPLAIAAGLAELRALLSDAEGADVLRDLLHEIANVADVHVGPTVAGCVLEAAVRLARQGLGADQRRTVLKAVHAAALDSRAPAEQQAIIWTSMATAFGPELSDAPSRSLSALREADSDHDVNSRSRSAERLALLRRAMRGGNPADDEWMRQAALSAAAEVVASAVIAHEHLADDALGLLCSAWQMMPRDRAAASRASVVQALRQDEMDGLLNAAQQQPPVESVRELRLILREAPVSAKARVAARLTANDLRDASTWDSDLEWASTTRDTAQVLSWFEASAAGLQPDDCVVRCVELIRRRAEPAVRALVAERALNAIGELGPSLCRDAMAALLDFVMPEGLGDSFEAWRSTNLRERHDRPLAWDIREMLCVAQVTKQSAWSAAQRLADTPIVRGMLGADWSKRMDIVRRLMSEEQVPSVSRAPGEVSATRLTVHASPETQAAAAIEGSSPRSLAASLSSLAAMAGEVDPQVTRAAVPHVLNHAAWNESGAPFSQLPSQELAQVLTIVAAWPFWPPHDDTLAALTVLARELWSRADVDESLREELLGSAAMPDIARQALLAVALRRATGPANKLNDLSLPFKVARLMRPTDKLLTDTLSALRQPLETSESSRAECLVALLAGVREQTLPRWLEAASTLDAKGVATVVRGLDAFGPDAIAHFGPILNGVARIRSPRQRAQWLIELAGGHRAWRVDDAVAIAVALPDERDQLRVSCALLPALPHERRAGVLIDALQLAPRNTDAPEISRALVQMAADSSVDPALRTEAVAAAVAITDRDLRSDAVAALVPVLPADQTAAAVAAARRIGDVAPRVRALRALAEVCSGRRTEAVTRMLRGIQSLPDGGSRAAAALYVAPLVPVPDRWEWMRRAFVAPSAARGGFEWVEVFDAIGVALADAPERVMAAALRWIARHPRSANRTRTLTSLMHSLPTTLRFPALMLIAEDGGAIDAAARWPARELEAAFAAGPAHAKELLETALVQQRRSAEAFLEVSALDNPSTEDVGRILDVSADDMTRRSIVRRLSLCRDLSPLHRRRLAEAAKQIGDASLRRDAVRSLAVLAPARSLPRAADAVAAIERPADRALAQLRLAARLTGRSRDKMLDLALASAAADHDQERRVAAAVACVIEAPVLLTSVLELLAQSIDGELKVNALGELLQRLPDATAAAVVARVPELLTEDACVRVLSDVTATGGTRVVSAVLTAAGRLPLAVSRARVLAAWAHRLDDSLQARASDLLEGISTDFAWLEALSSVAARWPSMLTRDRAERAAATLVDIADEGLTTTCLRATAAAWPPAACGAYVAAARALRDEALKSEALGWGLFIGDGSPRPEWLAAVREVEDPRCRSILLGQAALASEPADDLLLEEALRDARSTGHRELRMAAMASMVARAHAVPWALFDALLNECGDFPLLTLQAFRDLARKLDAAQAVELVRALPWDRLRAVSAECAALLKALAVRVTPSHLHELLDLIPRVCRPRHASDLLSEMAPLIQGDARSAALSAALSLGSTWRAQALTAIADRLEPTDQELLLAALLDTPHEAERMRRLAGVRSKLSGNLVDRWHEAGERLRFPELRSALLAMTDEGEALSDSGRVPATEQENVAAGDRIIDALLAELPSAERTAATPARRGVHHASVLPGVLERLGRMESEDDRFDEITRALPTLTSSERFKLLTLLDTYLSARRHDTVVPLLAAGLTGEDRLRLPAVFERISTPQRVGHLLRACHASLGPDLREPLLLSLRRALHSGARRDRRDTLPVVEAWAPVVTLLGGDAAVIDTIAAIDDVAEQWP
jgi:hypothetical protein